MRYVVDTPKTLTALQIACSVDALPGPCTPSIYAAGRPAVPPVSARAAANPTPLDGDLARGAHGAGIDAVAVADHVGRGAGTHGWVF